MKIGFIGVGKIGQAIIKGLLSSQVNNQDIMVLKSHHHTAEKVAQQYHLSLANDYSALNVNEIVIVAVPQSALKAILEQLKAHYHGLIVSTSGGDLTAVNAELPVDTSFVKAVPNTPVQINAGITALSFTDQEPEAQRNLVINLFQKLGQVYVVPEKLLGIYGTVAGCTPAFVDIMMEALSDAAVINGIPRQQSYQIITQMLLGTAQLAQKTQQHPGQLKDEVTTPGGSTIRGVAELEATGFRNALIQAVQAANN